MERWSDWFVMITSVLGLALAAHNLVRYIIIQKRYQQGWKLPVFYVLVPLHFALEISHIILD